MAVELDAIQVTAEQSGKILIIRVMGKLQKEDYEAFIPQIEKLIEEHGKLRVLFDMHDFHGWSAGALWEDVKFDLKHFKDIERLAIVGESKWQHGMAVFCKPFTTAEIRYFDRSEFDKARKWIEEDDDE